MVMIIVLFGAMAVMYAIGLYIGKNWDKYINE